MERKHHHGISGTIVYGAAPYTIATTTHGSGHHTIDSVSSTIGRSPTRTLSPSHVAVTTSSPTPSVGAASVAASQQSASSPLIVPTTLMDESIMFMARMPNGDVRQTTCHLRMKQQTPRVFTVRLTQEDDLRFLYLMEMSESDFENFRKDARFLAVDFLGYPISVRDQLISPNHDSERYIVLEEKAARSLVLSVLQKSLPWATLQLSLQFVPANDRQLHDYLIDKVEGLRHRCSDHEHTNQTLLTDRDDIQRQFTDCKAQLTSNLASASLTEEKMTLEHSKDVMQVRDTHAAHIRDLEQKHSIAIDKLKHDYDMMQSEYQSLKDRYAQQEAKLTVSVSEHGTTRSHLEQSHKDMAASKNTINELRASLLKLEAECYDIKSQLQTATLTIASLGGKDNSNGEAILRLTSERDGAIREHKTLNALVSRLQSDVKTLTDTKAVDERDMKQLRDTIATHVQTIATLDNKLSISVSKIYRFDAALKEEIQVKKELESSAKLAEKDMTALQRELKHAEAAHAKLVAANTALEKKLESNEHVIFDLNSQLNAAQGGGIAVTRAMLPATSLSHPLVTPSAWSDPFTPTIPSSSTPIATSSSFSPMSPSAYSTTSSAPRSHRHSNDTSPPSSSSRRSSQPLIHPPSSSNIIQSSPSSSLSSSSSDQLSWAPSITIPTSRVADYKFANTPLIGMTTRYGSSSLGASSVAAMQRGAIAEAALADLQTMSPDRSPLQERSSSSSSSIANGGHRTPGTMIIGTSSLSRSTSASSRAQLVSSSPGYAAPQSSTFSKPSASSSSSSNGHPTNNGVAARQQQPQSQQRPIAKSVHFPSA